MLSGYGIVIAGVSGGADSVCLIMVLKELISQYGLPMRLVAVHVNHGIRGREALRDENFSKELCRKLEVEFISCSVDVPAIAKRDRLSEEEAGRILRYRIFHEIAAKKEAQYGTRACIAVAHHKNDQAETVLMNLTRGSSLRGLCGIHPVRDNIIRPLLCVERKEIERYLEERKIPYVTDSTNLESAYTRNKVRQELIPYLEEQFNGNVVERIAEMAENLSEAESYIGQQADNLYERCVDCDLEKEIAVIHLERFLPEAAVLQRYVVRRIIGTLTGKRKDVYSTHIEAILSLCTMQTGKSVSIAYGLKAVRKYDDIVISAAVLRKEDFGMKTAQQEYCHIPDRQKLEQIWQGNPYILPVPVLVYLQDRKKLCRIKIVMEQGSFTEISGNNDYTKLFDYDRIKDNLCIRFRQESDCIMISRKGITKTLKKELVDRKVIQEMRNQVLLFACGQRILWAVGIRRSEDCLVEPDTKRILKISVTLQEDKEYGTTTYQCTDIRGGNKKESM